MNEDDYLKTNFEPRHDSNRLERWLSNNNFKPPFHYNLELFKALNTYYADNPLVPKPRILSPNALFAQADKRVTYLLKLLPSFDNIKCLEVGCGRGETAVQLAKRGNCSVTGVDIPTYPEWEERWSDKTKFLPKDITYDIPFNKESFDFIYSFVTLEHVTDPISMIDSMHTLLKKGGTLYFTANLYRGPSASHRYREVFFPWPHLIFNDKVFKDYYVHTYSKYNIKPAWVNKLTHLHYIEKTQSLGMKCTNISYTIKNIDNDFYECFHEILSKYPKKDLEIDFIKMQLIK